MTTLTLGTFTFADFEIPEHIPFGTEQALVVHKLVGGTRQIDVMGATPKTVQWSGWFTGSNAVARAEQLQALVQKGQKLALTWDALAYTVVIGSVDCDFKTPWRVSYSIVCEPVSNDSQPSTSTTGTDTDQVVADDVSDTTTKASNVGDPTLISNVGAVAAGISALGTLASASVAAVRAVSQSIAVAQRQAVSVRASISLAVSAPSSTFDTTPSGLTSFSAALAASAQASQSSSDVAVIQATLGRIAVNTTADINGVSTITVAGGDLFSVAAREYGDATLWTAIANANGLTDPYLTGVTKLIIPPQPANATGGVLNA